MRSGIYRIVVTRGENTPKFYIGQSVNFPSRRARHLRDLKNGRHDNSALQRAFVKYGERCFSFEMLLVCEPSADVLAMHEQRILDSYSRGVVYNVHLECVTSALGIKRSPETIEKKRIAALGNKSRSGMPHTIESRKKMAVAVGRYIATKDQSWRRTAALGNKSNLGKRFSPEHRLRLSASVKATKAARKAERSVKEYA